MLSLKNVSYEVDADSPGRKEIIKDVSLDIGDDNFIVITGPNGGGKSTLAKLIMGIVRPSKGQILLDGKDITNWTVTERAKAGIGFAFQQPVRFKGLTIKRLIELASGRPLSVEQACGYLGEVGLCARDYIFRGADGSLSGGELKRIEIAMLLARGTKISVFDEPEAGIDLWSFHNLIKVFKNLRTATHGAIVIISHQERILEVADKVVVIAGGRITQTGTKDEVLPGLLKNTSACKYYKEDITGA